MSDFPIALHGERVRAVIIGGGKVGTRKALALADSGAAVLVVAPEVTADLAEAGAAGRVALAREDYAARHLGQATLVIAATSSREVNARIAVDAHALGKLVNITDFPDEGSFHTMALHRSGDMTIGVSAGGVPGAAVRIRDALAERFDGRYGRAISALRGLRARLIAGGGAGAGGAGGERWRTAVPILLADDFCASVEDGSFADRVESWR